MMMQDPIEEAQRYIANAKTILREKGEKNNGVYGDSKYVRMAGDTIWHGILIALNTIITLPHKKNGRDSKKDYESIIKKSHTKIFSQFMASYQQFHLTMGYDGVGTEKQIKASLQEADFIINYCNEKRNKQPKLK